MSFGLLQLENIKNMIVPFCHFLLLLFKRKHVFFGKLNNILASLKKSGKYF